MTAIKATITYKLSDLLALAADMKAGHEQKAAEVANQKGHELIAGYSAAMVTGTQRVIDKLEEFRAAGVEVIEADHLIREAHPHTPVFNGGDTSLSSQLRNNQIRPVTP